MLQYRPEPCCYLLAVMFVIAFAITQSVRCIVLFICTM